MNCERLSLTAMAALAMGLGAAPAYAQATRSFDVPAGSLGAAIARVGQQGGAVVTADAGVVRGRSTSGLKGEYTTPQALDRLLEGHALAAEPDGRGGFRIVSRQPSAAPRPAPASASDASAVASDLDAVVVVGALTDIEILGSELEYRQANDLADVFRAEPSVSVGGSVGIAQKIYVRGLEDSMLNVTVDGAPQRGTLFHHIGRVSIEPELLKTVDVQAGAGEATAGFGAIGGAIRFRTKDAQDLLAPGQTFGGIVKAGYFSNAGYKVSGTVFGRLFGDVGFVGSLVHVDRDDMKDGGGDKLLGTDARQQLGYLKVGGDLGGGHRLMASYEHREEKAAFAQRPNWPVLASNPLFPAEGVRQTAVLNYGYEASEVIALETVGYWTRAKFTQDRSDRWGLYGAEIETYGLDARALVTLAGHDVVVGAEYRNDRVMSQYLDAPSRWQDWAWDPTIGRFSEKGEVFGVYAQDHWQATDALLISLGGRYDSYEMSQRTYGNGAKSDGFSFNAGFDYRLTDALVFNGGFAQAFRGKEIGDAFTLEKRPGRIAIAPGLKPERVDNYEVGFAYDRGPWRASAVYYTMTIDNVIFDQIGSGPPPQDSVYYENVGKFEADGIELRAGYASGPFSIDAYYNHYRSELNGDTVEGYEHIGLANSVGDNWNLTAGYETPRNVRLEASVTHYAALNDIEVLQRNVEIGWIDQTQFVDKPGYTVVDLIASWRPYGDDRLTLLAAVYNLFDKRYRSHSSVADYGHIPDYEGVVGVYEAGRDIRVTAALRF